MAKKRRAVIKRLFQGIKESFKTKGRGERYTLVVSLLIALFIWFLHTFSSGYAQYFRYNIQARSNIEGRSFESKSQDIILLRGRATGFYILKRFVSKDLTLNINIDNKFLKLIDAERDIYSVATNDIREQLVEAIANNVEIDYVATDSIHFVFPKVVHKKVPIVVNTDISYKSQYMPVGRIIIEPDSTTIYGEYDRLEGIDSVYTNLLHLRQLDKSTQGLLSLSRIRGIRFSETDILYSVNVDRYVENEIKVPINTINVPQDRELKAYPSTVTVTYRHAYGRGRNINSESFNIVVDYNDYIESISSKVIPKMLETPDHLYHVSFDPPFVECILIYVLE